jgi:hypothetical protein
MFDYDAFEGKAGHEITLIPGLHAGVYTYYCENCGAIVQVGGPESKLILFHVPRGSHATDRKCVKAGSAVANAHSKVSLKEKLEEADNVRLKKATGV